MIDSSFLIAFKVRNDINHKKASALMTGIATGQFGRPFLTNYVFDETVTGIFVRSKDLEIAVKYGNELMSSLEIFEVDLDLFREAWNIFSSQKASELSFTDSTTIAVMNRRGVTRIATFDRDFQGLRGIDVVSA